MMIAILEKHSCDMRHSETYETYRTAKSGYRSGEQRCREKQQAEIGRAHV